MQPARLLRDVPEKSEGFPFGAPTDHPELRTFVVLEDGFSRSWVDQVGASLAAELISGWDARRKTQR
jgi:hypothetical protein